MHAAVSIVSFKNVLIGDLYRFKDMKPKQILIIDDEPKIIKALCDAFRFEEGFSVHGISDGAKALEYLKTNVSDLVVLDWRLSGDIQGRDILKFIKAEKPVVPVWVVTASIHFMEEIDSFQPTASYLKPCSQLKDKIVDYFKGR